MKIALLTVVAVSILFLLLLTVLGALAHFVQ